jgi:uncharacterized lipoprotein YbaY
MPLSAMAAVSFPSIFKELPMRAPLILAVILAFGLAACNNNQPPPPPPPPPEGPPPVAADVTAIRGQMSIDGLTELPRGLQLRLRLLDMSDPSVVPPVVAERVEPAPGSLPYRYALPFDPAAIEEGGRYVVEAALLSDEFVMYGTPVPVPALTNGRSRAIDLRLTRGGAAEPVVAPADALAGKFESLERAIGGMTRISGERIEGNATIGWDAFVDDSGVRFAREVVDYGAAGTASFRYAYRDGEPWVVAREQGGTLTMVGWGDDGSVLLNRSGEENGAIDTAGVERLHKMSADLHRIASRQR